MVAAAPPAHAVHALQFEQIGEQDDRLAVRTAVAIERAHEAKCAHPPRTENGLLLAQGDAHSPPRR